MIAAFEDAPDDDEPTTPEEDRSAAAAWTQRHDSVSLDEFRREFGLTAGWRVEITPPARRDLRRVDQRDRRFGRIAACTPGAAASSNMPSLAGRCTTRAVHLVGWRPRTHASR